MCTEFFCFDLLLRIVFCMLTGWDNKVQHEVSMNNWMLPMLSL